MVDILEKSKDRLNICDSCEFLFKPTKSCKKCGCFMFAKTLIPSAHCPEHKWGSYEPQEEQINN